MRSFLNVSSYELSQLPDQASYKINQMAAALREVWTEIYPIGSYYETSDGDFDPNKVWGGEWEEVSAGRWHRTA